MQVTYTKNYAGSYTFCYAHCLVTLSGTVKKVGANDWQAKTSSGIQSAISRGAAVRRAINWELTAICAGSDSRPLREAIERSRHIGIVA